MNVYSVSSLLVFIICLCLGYFVYSKGKKDIKNNLFALVTVLTGIWCLFPFLTYITRNELQALFWARIVYIAAVIDPSIFLHFTFAMIGSEKYKREKNILKLVYIVSFIFLLFLFSSLFMKGIKCLFFYSYIMPGPLYLFFVIFFGIVCLYAFYRLFKSYQFSTGYKKNQLKYILLGFIIAFIGGIIHFGPPYGIKEFFPHDFLVITYTGIITYAIIRYRLMDITVIIKKTFIFGLFFGGAIAAMYLPMFLWQEFLRDVFGGAWWILVGLVFFIILATAFPLYRLLVRLTDHWLFQKKYDYQKTLKEVSKGMIEITDPDRLSAVIARFLNKKIRTQHTTILVWDEISQCYDIRGSYGEKKPKGIKLDKDNSLINWFVETRNIIVKRKLLKKKYVDVLVKEELDRWLEDENLINKEQNLKLELNNVKLELEKLEASVVIPGFYKNGLIAMLILGDKLSGDMYTQEDLDILSTLANDAAVAIKNAQLFNNLAQEEEKMKAVFDNMSDGALLTDSNFRVVMFNNACCNLLNLTAEEFLAKSFIEIMSNFKTSVSTEEIRESRKKNFVCEMSRYKGKPLFIANRINRVVDEKGNTFGYIMVLSDITTERTEEKLKKNFLALISHKLRTPLTPILGYAQLIMQEKELSDSQRNIMRTISEQSQILSGLINQLISFTTLEEETIELELTPVDLNMLIQAVIYSLTQLIEKTNTQILIDDSLIKMPKVYVDKDRVKEAVKTLVENAIKFNDKEIKKVKIFAVLEANKFVQVGIQDNGQGIPGEEFDKIFQKFYQIEEGFTGQIKGAGLGLALVKRIIEVHNGRVWVESKLTEGSIFYFTLPVADIA